MTSISGSKGAWILCLALASLLPASAASGDDAPAAARPAAVKALAKQRARFVKACLGLARRYEASDPGLTRRAAHAVLAVAPENTDALLLLERIGPPQGIVPGSLRTTAHVPAWASRWRDLLHDGTFGTLRADGHLAVPSDGSNILGSRRAVDTGSRYVLELDIRPGKTTGSGPTMLGLEFGGAKGGTLTAFVSGGLLVLDEAKGDSTRLIAQADVTSSEAGGWFRLAVVVDGRSIDVWLGGRPVLRGYEATARDLAGSVGIVHTNCEATVRHVRLGTAR